MSPSTKRTILTLSIALIACAVLYFVMLREEEQAAAAAEPMPTPTLTPAEPFGPRAEETLAFLEEQGLLIETIDAALGEYRIAHAEGSAHPLTILPHADGSVAGFYLVLPSWDTPTNPGESAIDQALVRMAREAEEAEAAAIAALLPPLLEGATDVGVLPEGTRTRWVQAAKLARLEPFEAESGAYTFSAEVREDGCLRILLEGGT